jgi:hypothetical protein
LPHVEHIEEGERMTSVHVPETITIPSAVHDTDSYVRALLEVAGDREPFTVVGTTPANARALCRQLPPDGLEASPADGEWSALLLIGHLFDVDIVYGFRWRLVITQDGADYPGYDEKLWAPLPRLPFWQLLNAWEGLRACNVALLRGVPKDAWQRTGGHGEQGPETLETMIRKVVGHDIAHLNQLYRTVRAVRQASGLDLGELDETYREWVRR